MDFMFKLGIVCILIASVSQSGLSEPFPPRFDTFPFPISLYEGCSNRTLATITARGRNGVITISANDDATRAKVDIVDARHTTTGGVDSTTVQIKQKACMDRETEPSWYLHLLAADKLKEHIETLLIFILDVNDERPSFTSNFYKVYVSENTSLSSEILRATATDPDNGMGGVVRYTLESAALYGNTFGIDAYSGSITVKTELDYSKLKFYEYLIVGTDEGGLGLKGNATLLIMIQPIATAMTPHNTIASDNFMFRYDSTSHVMVVILQHTCYVYIASDTESVDLHTSHGIHQLEIKLITMVYSTSATYVTLSHDELTALSKSTARFCNRVGWTSHKLN
ncbi:protocadherin alpha-11-like [Mytilus edulis]|uniref:protocadherin alpha-11-like n=1 Tax=Mytilus edulis TaxID=6550 RepID=UPI0039EF36BA